MQVLETKSRFFEETITGKIRPSLAVWCMAVFALIVQQGAFMSTPLLLQGYSLVDLRDTQNPYNTYAIALSFILIGTACLPRILELAGLASKNISSFLLVVMVLSSAIWSIHPDLSIRRGTGYVLTILVAAYLSLRFDLIDRFKVLSASFAISAISSLLFAAIFPQFGIMQLDTLVGDWQGVFPHKNVLGPAMSVAVFIELFLLVAGDGRPRWRFVLLGTYLALVTLSHSVTAMFISLMFVAGTCIYLVWKRDKLMGIGISIIGFLFLSALIIVFCSDPKAALGLVGKDTGLTGRTALWSSVLPLIEQRIVLGWGFRAMWQVNDPAAILPDEMASWGAGHSHNSFLEIALQLGLAGLAVVAAVVIVSLWRGIQCCKAELLPLGWFSLMFFTGMTIAGMTEQTLAQNQNVAWVVFNVLSFSCGTYLSSLKRSNGMPTMSSGA